MAMTGAHLLVVASLTGQLTSWIGHHGAYAVFAIMALDALLPVGGELTMLYAGALAAGAIAGSTRSLFGHQLQTGLESYLVLAHRRHARLPRSARWSAGRSAAGAAGRCSSATGAGCTSSPRTSSAPSAGSIATAGPRSSSGA